MATDPITELVEWQLKNGIASGEYRPAPTRLQQPTPPAARLAAWNRLNAAVREFSAAIPSFADAVRHATTVLTVITKLGDD